MLVSTQIKKLTNTSARKHLCQTLIDNNISDKQAVFWTGHANAQSLNNYRHVSSEKQHQVSNLLCGSRKSDTDNLGSNFNAGMYILPCHQNTSRQQMCLPHLNQFLTGQIFMVVFLMLTLITKNHLLVFGKSQRGLSFSATVTTMTFSRPFLFLTCCLGSDLVVQATSGRFKMRV